MWVFLCVGEYGVNNADCGNYLHGCHIFGEKEFEKILNLLHGTR